MKELVIVGRLDVCEGANVMTFAICILTGR